MDLRMLRYFLAIVDCGSATAASKQLFLAQPSLSRQLRRFETTLGVQLFSRMDRRLVLDHRGTQFVPIARALVARAAQAETLAAAIAAGPRRTSSWPRRPRDQRHRRALHRHRGRVSVANVIETPACRGLRRDHPRGRRLRPPHLGADALADAEVPIRVEVWAQMPDGHELAAAEAVDLLDLVRHPLVHLDSGHAVRRAFDAAAAERGLTYDTIAQTRAPRLGQALAAAGRGVCVTSDDPRYGLSKARLLVDGEPLTVTLYAAWDHEHYASADIEETIGDLRTFTVARYARDEVAPPG